jgi:hypothetical protein
MRHMICGAIERGPTFSVAVSREMFDFIERLWEPPAAQEWLHS